MDPKQAQEVRAKEYGIGIKEGGHVTKSSEWEGVPDDQFLDPVNYRYPCPDAEQTATAAKYWGKPDNQAQYSEEERKIVSQRLAEREKHFKIGEYAEEQSRASIQTARVLASKDPEGMVWDVVIIQPGLTLHRDPFYFSAEVLGEAAPLFEGAACCAFELPSGLSHMPDDVVELKKLLIRNKVGWFEKARMAAEGIVAELHLVESAKWLGENILEGFKSGKRDILGLSIDAPIRATIDKISGTTAIVVSKILGVDSVDVVDMPAAGGRFVRAVADLKKEKEEKTMKEKLLRLLAALRPDVFKDRKIEEIKDEEIEGLIAQCSADPQKNDPAKDAADKKVLDEVKVLRCEMSLKEKLSGSELPEVAQKRVSKAFVGRIFEEKELDQAIADEKDYLARFSQAASNPAGLGDSRARVQMGLAPIDKLQLALDMLVGLRDKDYEGLCRCRKVNGDQVFEGLTKPDLSGMRAFRGIREAYLYFSGDREMDGRFHPENLPKDLRMTAAFTSATFTYALAATIHRKLTRDYLEVDFGERRIINVVRAEDFKTREAVRVGYFGDISTVDPETADYQELAAYGDEEATYTVGQKGNLVTITRKHIVNDDIGAVAKIPTRLGRAIRRTFAKFVWGFPMTNAATTYDGVNWFHGNHGNLGANALAILTIEAALTAFRNQTAPGSSEPIGVMGILLAVPTALEWIAKGCNLAEYVGNPADGNPNPIRNYFGMNHENILVLPLLTDATDWYLFGNPADGDIIEVAFLFGQETPEYFVADVPNVGEMFKADKLQHKFRHEYGGAVVDHRNAYKAVVAG